MRRSMKIQILNEAKASSVPVFTKAGLVSNTLLDMIYSAMGYEV